MRKLTTNQRRNVNPTPLAVAAMHLFPQRYASQDGGSMDFWGSLSESDQRRCRDLLADIERAERAHGIRS